MTQTNGQTVQYLADYRPYPFVLSATRMTFALQPEATRVRTALSMAPRDPGAPQDLVLDGGKGVELLSLTIDGEAPDPAHVLRRDETLTVAAAALPVAGNVYILAQHFGLAEQRTSAAILISTAFGIATIPLVMSLIGS